MLSQTHPQSLQYCSRDRMAAAASRHVRLRFSVPPLLVKTCARIGVFVLRAPYILQCYYEKRPEHDDLFKLSILPSAHSAAINLAVGHDTEPGPCSLTVQGDCLAPPFTRETLHQTKTVRSELVAQEHATQDIDPGRPSHGMARA